MPDPTEIADILNWAHTEIRELDELCRSMVAGYGTLSQDELERLKEMKHLEAELRNEAKEDEAS